MGMDKIQRRREAAIPHFNNQDTRGIGNAGQVILEVVNEQGGTA
jgi:hypothetical protein